MELAVIKQPRVFPRRLAYRAGKRVFDICLCLLALPFAFPVALICALAILIDSPGPAFFIQERVGKGGHSFRMVKFRTMRTELSDRSCREFMKKYVRGEVREGENGQETFKPAQARQITRIGRLLRKTSLDELPQIINVLRGEMSLVGPRPNVTWEVEEYRPWHHERMEVLPGITGLAQVRGRSCIDFNTLVRYDIEYVEKQSMRLDLMILWWTLASVCLGKGAG